MHVVREAGNLTDMCFKFGCSFFGKRGVSYILVRQADDRGVDVLETRR